MNISHPGKCVALWCVVLALHLPARAQTRFTLDSLVQLSRQNLPLLKQKRALVEGSRASLTDVRHSFLPQVRASEQVNIGSNNSLAGSLFTYGITPSSSAGVRADNTWQPVTGNAAVIYGEYELYNFGLNHAKLGYARSQVDLQQADLDRDTYNVTLELARSYLQAVKQEYRIAADSQNVERYKALYTVINALTSSGIKPGADSSMAKAELARSRIGYNQSRGRLNQLLEQLSYLTGVPPARIAIDTSTGGFKMQRLLPAFAADTAQNPLLAFYERKTELLRQNEDLIRKSYRPKILLSASTWARGSSIQFNDQFKSLETGLGYQRFNYLAGVTFSYNLLNGIYRKDKLSVNRFQRDAANHEREQQRLLLSTAARQASQATAMIQENLQQLPVQLQAAEAAYQQKTAQYKAGLISLIDVVNATFVLYRSQTDYIEAVSDWYLAQLERAAATGHLALFIQLINQ